MKKINTTVLFVIILMTVSAIASGRDIYVAKNGNDANAGTQASPYLTIGKAAGVAMAGDVVYIRSRTGKYR